MTVIHGGLSDQERDALIGGREVIDLSANLHPDGPPREVIEALRGIDPGRYPSIEAEPLRAALAALHGVDPECVIVTPGASAGIYLAVGALLAPGGRCAIFEPTFGEYARAVFAAGGVVVSATAGEPRFDVSEPPPAEMAVLCNPNNPTGRVVPRRTVETLLRRTRVLVIDAAYEALAEDAWDATALVRAGAPVVVIHSMTKLFAMPGMRVGYLVAPRAIAAVIRTMQPPWPVGAGEIAAGLAALDAYEARRATVPALRDRRRRIEAALTALGAMCAPSTTNFALAEVGDAARFRAALLERGFAVRDATSFGLPTWVRIAVPSEAAMPALLEALRGAYAAVSGAPLDA
ncbi:MAG: histidinol-phosphate transaminase [Chloroflexota bacterium]